MKITDLGQLNGTVLVFGGIYSNLQALDGLISYAKSRDIPAANMICTGDVVAYCADANACVQRIIDLGCPVLAGNCEEQLAQGQEDCGCGFDAGSTCSILSRTWYTHAQEQVSDSQRKWMASLPQRIVFTHQGRRFGVVHGGATDISRFIWPVTGADVIVKELQVLGEQVGAFDTVLAGHSGIPMQVDVGGKQWINSGAIGMPSHNGSPDTHFALISASGIEFKTLTYDVNAAYNAMVAAGLTQGYHDCLKSGYWPSEETLPNEMHVALSDRVSPQVGGVQTPKI